MNEQLEAISALSDEELEAKFMEVFGESDTIGEGAEPEPTSDDNTAGDGNFANEPQADVEIIKYSITTSNGTKEFELTLSDINWALHSLVNNTYGESDNTYYSVSVFEKGYVVMEDWYSGKAYKQSYGRDGENFHLTGDRVEVFANWLTREEETSLAEMRENIKKRYLKCPKRDINKVGIGKIIKLTKNAEEYIIHL